MVTQLTVQLLFARHREASELDWRDKRKFMLRCIPQTSVQLRALQENGRRHKRYPRFSNSTVHMRTYTLRSLPYTRPAPTRNMSIIYCARKESIKANSHMPYRVPAVLRPCRFKSDVSRPRHSTAWNVN